MPKINVKKTIKIKSKPEKIYEIVADFTKWITWSPWLISEPETKVTFTNKNKSYHWKGKIVGEGKMDVTEENENQSISYDLNFLKPFKSYAKVRFELEEQGEDTQVSWYMESKFPFFLFFMKKPMEAYIGMDYERGLMMLKDLIERGEIPSKLSIIGNQSFEGFPYVGIRNKTTVKGMPEAMSKDFEKLKKLSETKNYFNYKECKGFSQYHVFDLVKDKVEYTCGCSVAEIPKDLPDGIIAGHLDSTQVYTIRHTGNYQHLGNAWSAMIAYQRAKVFKNKGKKFHPFEIYENDPESTDEKDLITDVHFAVK